MRFTHEFLFPMPSEIHSPFVIEHSQISISPNQFTPGAKLVITPTLRTSGLLKTLSDEAVRSLLAVLACLTPNGRIQPTSHEVGEVLGLPESQARQRLRRLAGTSFEGMPLLALLHRETGMHGFIPSHAVVSESQVTPPEQSEVINLPIPPPASRERVIEHSRATYGRPREEVERIIAEQLGHSVEETLDTPDGEARRQLIRLGVPRDEVQRLVNAYPLESIFEQIEWLPLRGAKSPVRYLIAAIEGDYEPPAKVRLERMVQQDSEEKGEAGGQE